MQGRCLTHNLWKALINVLERDFRRPPLPGNQNHTPQDEATNSSEFVASFFVVGYLATAWMKLRTKSNAVPAKESLTG